MSSPRTLIPPNSLPVRFYKMFKRTQWCASCGKQHVLSEIFAAYPIRSGYGYSRVTRPGEIEYNLPVVVESPTTETTMFCHECWKPGMLNHLSSPPAPVIPPSWVGKGEAQDKPKSEPKPKKQPKSAPGTIDDLDF